ncbi:phage minor head protein [Mycobacteroides abscessus]|uniref:phage minor head protein n=1 Tax=Mycobacteroides abscessus TaxID=36809 RepID=UPI000C265C83|nr:phage minor head protein [Mycobacteroides abscessus]
MNRHALLEARAELTQAIRASEEWTQSYKRHQDVFRALLKHEAELERQTAEYLAGLAQRAPEYVDWDLVPEPIKAASTPLANKDDAVWQGEAIDMTKAIIEALTMLTATGAHFGELEYGIDLGVTSLTDWVMTAAREHTAGLVSQVTDTNRKLIQEAIKKGIALGEDRDAMVARIRKVINNPVRAEMIAQTESVTAYQSGILNFGLQTGAKRKVYEALAGACKICAPLDGEVVDIDKPFSNGVDHPPSHVRCRCSSWLEY